MMMPPFQGGNWTIVVTNSKALSLAMMTPPFQGGKWQGIINSPALPGADNRARNERSGLIAAQSAKVETLKLHKKGLMQQLFPSTKDVES